MALRTVRGSWSAWAGVGAVALASSGALAVVSVQGCTVTDVAASGDAGVFEASTTGATAAACGTCVAQECVGPSAVCLTDERCLKLRACANPFAESQGARDECFCSGSAPTDGGAGVDPLAAYVAFASCNDARTCTACSADCSSSCAVGSPQTRPTCTSGDAGADADAAAPGDAGDAGDAADSGDSGIVAPAGPSVDGCAQCVAGRCDAARKLCALGSECAAFLACAQGCSDASCVAACGTSRSTGKASAMELSSCTLTSCRSACGL